MAQADRTKASSSAKRNAAHSRSARVAATDAGRDQLLKAAPTYFATIRVHLFEGLAERDVKHRARTLGRMQAGRQSR